MPTFYITTPIYYVNDAPHLGHAYTTIAADALARFHRMSGDDTRFLTGTDEHGLKIEQAATARGLAPIELADQVVERFRSTWRALDISNDDFVRTTEERHKRVVGELWRKMVAAGDIYLGAYEGWYCVACEAYYAENQLSDGNLCLIHRTPASWLSEPTYFFKLSRYQEPLLDHIARDPGFIQPEGYRNEVVSFLRSGLKDLSVSRTTFRWGVPVPDDPAHVVYVWIDALANYYSALSDDGGGRDLRSTFWAAGRGPHDAIVHLIGKDILRFHAVYWPAMLLSAGLPLPTAILCHGWWSVRGEKISKSMPATRVDPNRLAADLGADALRYFVLREVPLGLDGDFTYEALIGRYNAELANDLGNLVSRSMTMTEKFAGGRVPDADVGGGDAAAPLRALRQTAEEVIGEADRAFRGFQPSRALESIWRLVREANGFVGATEPWKLARDPAQAGELARTMRAILESIALVARLIAPVMPATARKIAEQLGAGGRAAEMVAHWPAGLGDALTVGAEVRGQGALFPRIDEERQAQLLEAWIPADARVAGATAPVAPEGLAKAAKAGKADKAAPKVAKGDPGAGAGGGGEVDFDLFGRLDLRVAVVRAAEPVKGAKKLLKLELDVGEERSRQVVAGIAERYAPEALIGKRVILLANLKPATIRGVTSEGMILAAGGDQVIGLSTVDVEAPPGTRIR